MDPQIPTFRLALGGGVLLISYIIVSTFIYPLFTPLGKFCRSHQWAGLKDGLFSQFRSGFEAIGGTGKMALEGYRKYGKSAFLIPQFGDPPLLVVSGEQLHEMMALNDSEIDGDIPNRNEIQADRTIRQATPQPLFDMIRKQLTRHVAKCTPEVFEEILLALDANWKCTADTWITVNVHSSCMAIVSQAANRVFVGVELCRNPEFLESCRKYTIQIFVTGAIYKSIPRWIHPIVAPILQIPINRGAKDFMSYLGPVVDDRVKRILEDPKFEPPQTALTWTVQDAIKLSKVDPSQLTRDRIGLYLVQLNMLSIHTTSILSSFFIMDLYTSPHRDEYVAALREECSRVLAGFGGTWSKDAVNQLHRVDSALKESLRMSAQGELHSRRQVVAPQGITLCGTHIPPGVVLITASGPIHSDPEIYPNPLEYNPFRFSQPREDYMAQVQAARGDDGDKDAPQYKNQALTTIGEEFLGFGFGKHSCPGRFFASQELKLMFAHILLTYDIEIDGERPANGQFNIHAFPKPEWQMRVRLRKPTQTGP